MPPAPTPRLVLVPVGFHSSITDSESRKRAGMTCRACVLSLMRIAGAENDRGKWMRLYVENPIGRPAADKAWREGTEGTSKRKTP